MSSEALTKREKQLYEYMLRNANEDISIHDMCQAIALQAGDARRAWQHLGAVISKVNKKQNQYEIVPGLQVKRTYRLQIKTLLI